MILTASSENSECHIAVQDFGAQVISWKTQDGAEQLFLSREEVPDSEKSLRGGVPIIFPQFGEFGSVKRHGFARSSRWRSCPSSKTDTICLTLKESPETLAYWPYRFIATFEATVMKNHLRLKLTIENSDQRPFSFTAALHSYFRVDQLNQTRVENLKGCEYWNNGEARTTRHRQNQDHLLLHGAIDRIYYGSPSTLMLTEVTKRRRILSKGFSETVVWNPGAEGEKALRDMGQGEHKTMVCVESAVIDPSISLQPQQQWQGEQNIEIV